MYFFQIDWGGGGASKKFSRYHQNHDAIWFLIKFAAFSYQQWGEGGSVTLGVSGRALPKRYEVTSMDNRYLCYLITQPPPPPPPPHSALPAPAADQPPTVMSSVGSVVSCPVNNGKTWREKVHHRGENLRLNHLPFHLVINLWNTESIAEVGWREQTADIKGVSQNTDTFLSLPALVFFTAQTLLGARIDPWSLEIHIHRLSLPFEPPPRN